MHCFQSVKCRLDVLLLCTADVADRVYLYFLTDLTRDGVR